MPFICQKTLQSDRGEHAPKLSFFGRNIASDSLFEQAGAKNPESDLPHQQVSGPLAVRSVGVNGYHMFRKEWPARCVRGSSHSRAGIQDPHSSESSANNSRFEAAFVVIFTARCDQPKTGQGIAVAGRAEGAFDRPGAGRSSKRKIVRPATITIVMFQLGRCEVVPSRPPRSRFANRGPEAA